MGFALMKAEKWLCFNKMLMCTTSYLSINLARAMRLLSHRWLSLLNRGGATACIAEGTVECTKFAIHSQRSIRPQPFPVPL